MLRLGSPSQSIWLPSVALPEDVVDEAVLRGVLELPDEPDQRERQDDRQVERGLVEARATDLAVEQDRDEDAERRGDEQEERRSHRTLWLTAGQKNG